MKMLLLDCAMSAIRWVVVELLCTSTQMYAPFSPSSHFSFYFNQSTSTFTSTLRAIQHPQHIHNYKYQYLSGPMVAPASSCKFHNLCMMMELSNSDSGLVLKNQLLIIQCLNFVMKGSWSTAIPTLLWTNVMSWNWTGRGEIQIIAVPIFLSKIYLPWIVSAKHKTKIYGTKV